MSITIEIDTSLQLALDERQEVLIESLYPNSKADRLDLALQLENINADIASLVSVKYKAAIKEREQANYVSTSI